METRAHAFCVEASSSLIPSEMCQISVNKCLCVGGDSNNCSGWIWQKDETLNKHNPWWMQPESQKIAKDEFRFQFATTLARWLNKWREKLL